MKICCSFLYNFLKSELYSPDCNTYLLNKFELFSLRAKKEHNEIFRIILLQDVHSLLVASLLIHLILLKETYWNCARVVLLLMK